MNTLQSSYTPIFLQNKKRAMILVALFLLCSGAFVLALSVGAAKISLHDALNALIKGQHEDTALKILLHIRLPRAIGAIAAGSALAVSGVIIQAVINNPMAAPNLIGVNAGAGFFTIAVMAIFPMMTAYLPAAAFVGALLTALLIFAISSKTGAGKITVTLIGIAVGSILTAGINTVKTLFPDSIYDISGFLIGGLSGATNQTVLPALIPILPSLVVATVLSRSLDALSLGENVASGLGINVKRTRILWLTVAALLSGAAVSFSGLIGFVGLLIPHIMRKAVGGNHRFLIPASMLGGGAFLLIADTLSRTLFTPYELPVGILMSLIGGPFFIILVLKQRRATK